jgi:Clostripain family
MTTLDSTSTTGTDGDRSWTIMIYMVPDAVLRGYAMSCIERMTAATPAKHFDVVVQLHLFGKPAQRLGIKGDDNHVDVPPIATGKNDPGDPEVLFSFLQDITQHFPASHYMLVLWGHALGFNFGNQDDPTTALELAQAVKRFAEKGRRLDILGCDACRMSKIELAALLSGSADLIVASETSVPLTSWPYKDILQAVSSDARITPLQLGRAIVDSYSKSYKQKGVSLAVLDLNHGTPVFQAVTKLGETLLPVLTDISERDNLRTAIATTSHDDVEPMIDLQEFCIKLAKGSANQAVKDAADAVVKLLNLPFIAKQEKRGPGVQQLRGVGIYVPRVLYDPALGNGRIREIFSWQPPASIPMAPGFAETWTQVVTSLVATELSSPLTRP